MYVDSKLKATFLITVGFLFVASIIRMQNTEILRMAQSADKYRNFLVFTPENEKTENEKERDRKFIEYSMKIMNDPNANNRSKRLPDIINIGTEKCGTGALMFLLGCHPMVLPAYKEIHFYDNVKSYAKGLDYYKSLLPPVAPRELLFEKTPSYFDQQPDTPEKIRTEVPNAKIVVVICDPVKRTFSDYHQEIWTHALPRGKRYDRLVDELLSRTKILNQNMDDDESHIKFLHKFGKGINHILTKGLFYYHLKRWYEYYEKNEIFIIDGEELVSNPASVIKRLQKFLNIPEFIIEEDLSLRSDGFYCFSRPVLTQKDGRTVVARSNPTCLSENKGKTRKGKNGTPSETSVEKLRVFFAPFNEKLFKLIGRRFDWT